MCFITYLKKALIFKLEKSVDCRLPLLTSNPSYPWKWMHMYCLTWKEERTGTMRNLKRMQMENCRGNISQGVRLEARTRLGGSCNTQMEEALNHLSAWRWRELQANETKNSQEGDSLWYLRGRGQVGLSLYFALPTLQATVVDASDSWKRSDSQILRKRKLAEPELACNSQKVQGCPIRRIKCWDALCYSSTPPPLPRLPWKVKSSSSTIEPASKLA